MAWLRNVYTLTQSEWDESKRSDNIRKHGIDFVDASLIFEGIDRGEGGHPQTLWRDVVACPGPKRHHGSDGDPYAARRCETDHQRMEGE